jgi:hypothetical protein
MFQSNRNALKIEDSQRAFYYQPQSGGIMVANYDGSALPQFVIYQYFAALRLWLYRLNIKH